MSGPLEHPDQEAEARRLSALLKEGRPQSLSAAKTMLARVMGRGSWHEVEQHLKRRGQGPANPSPGISLPSSADPG